MAEPYTPASPLAVVLDVKDPHSYLAKDPTYALADDLGVDIDWLPFVSRPLRRHGSGADRGSRHRRFRAAYQERSIARYAGARGLSVRDIYRAPDSSLAGMGMLAARTHSEKALRDYLDRAFRQYWEEGLDIEDADAISRLLSAAGVGEFDPDVDHFRALQERLALAGVFDTPAYLVDGDIFLGRAHLPMIRWILTGRAGPPPI
ncbi:MAG: DsbA family protein [Gammaproteobacteria bacterium]|nr:DsbA family protein [Gammaproteobacteria bacterium]MDE0452606.1 DsbA family protein [Gammaproteobacteria bacterium]